MDTGAVRPFLQMALLSREGAAWGEVSYGVPGDLLPDSCLHTVIKPPHIVCVRLRMKEEMLSSPGF